MRRIFAGLVVALLLGSASACGGGGTADEPKDKLGTIDDITVTGSPEATPKIDFNAPLKFDESDRAILEEGPGKGEAIDETSLVTMDYLGVNASDGGTIDSSYDSGQPATFRPADTITGFAAGLEGARAGDRVLITVASEDGYDPTGNQTTVRPGDSLIFVVDVIEVENPLTEAKGEAAPAPSSVPKLVYDDEGHPRKFKATKDTLKSLDKLGVHTIIEGNGEQVESGQTLTVEYVGQLYPDGKVFDESWSSDDLVSFPIGTGGVIKGWDKGLVGQRVGSRVILTIPSELGYGAEGNPQGGIAADADLVFVIDLLAVQ
ncbi:MAG: FKBP-type peptidyl-prolyl cis-trans isomerase [Actinomycetota bacterium]|nr:FKBP-type peptidyl-prolyl cis-trans isomerase [Actinomycetota bacterium]